MKKRQAASQEQLKTLRRLAAKEKLQTETAIKNAVEKNKKNDNVKAYQTEIEKLKNQLKAANETQKTTDDLLTTANNNLREAKEIIKALQENEKEQNDEIGNIKPLLKQAHEENAYLSQRLYEQRTGAKTSQTPKHTEPTNEEDNSNIKTLQWANSNGGRLIDHLQQTDGVHWASVKDIFKSKHIKEKALYKEENQKKMEDAQVMTVMMGLNELRGGYSAERAAKYYEEDIKPLLDTKKPVLLVQLPPVVDLKLKEEAAVLSKMIENIADKYPNAEYVELWSKLQHMPNDKIFENDGYHYDKNKQGAQIVAQTINQAVKETKEKHDKRVKNFKIKSGSAPYYIGKGGIRIKEMQETFKVNIQIPPGENRIVIQGSLHNIEQTEKELRNMTENLETQKERKALDVCYYYKKGLCWNGDDCHFSHEQEDRHKNKSRSRSPIRRTVTFGQSDRSQNSRSNDREGARGRSNDTYNNRSYARATTSYDRPQGRNRFAKQ